MPTFFEFDCECDCKEQFNSKIKHLWLLTFIRGAGDDATATHFFGQIADV